MLMLLVVLLQLWLSKVPGMQPQQIDDRMERGSYTVFDLNQWAQVRMSLSLHNFCLRPATKLTIHQSLCRVV